nr:DNA methyltransferase [Paraburkholderia ultramafica]
MQNDTNPDSVLGAFKDVYRVLKPDTFCVSFYGWSKVDAFFEAWTDAGFKPVGHLVWQKGYASRAGYLRARHEQAYLLVKGNPQRPAKPLDDVRKWEYSGNRFHPTEKAVSILTPLIQGFSQPGSIVLDPFSGSGSTAVAATLCGRRYLGIELEEKYVTYARNRLDGASRYVRGKTTSAA